MAKQTKKTEQATSTDPSTFTEGNWCSLVSNLLDEMSLTEKVRVVMEKGKDYLEIIADERKGVRTACRVLIKNLMGLDKVNMAVALEKAVQAIGVSTEKLEETKASVVRPNEDGSMSDAEAIRLKEMLSGGSNEIGRDYDKEGQLQKALPSTDDEVNRILGNKGAILDQLESE